MIDYIHSTGIVVSDQDRALAFYVDTLGWEKRIDAMASETMRFLTVAPKGARTELALMPYNEVGSNGRNADEFQMSLVASDLDATYEELKAKGVTFKGAPEEMPWGGRATWFNDLDGNEFFLSDGN